jgi:NAD dependent epimerase/dehydratase family enzyme
MLPFRLGVGGPIGNGRPYLPWISMPDWLSAVEFLLERSDISGPVNLTGPTPVRSAEFSRALGRQLRRPALIPVPKLAISAILGADFARETLSSLRVLPVVLTDRGFHFAHPTVDDALAVALPR